MSSTQVILLERVEKLGNMGDVVNVKPGFARNYLLPQKKALRASKDNIAYFEAQKKHFQSENDKLKKEAEKLLPKIDAVKVPLIRQASESGQLYGSVTARDIARQITEATGEKIDRSKVLMNRNYKQIGLFPVEVVLHPEVKAEVIVNIARSDEEAKIQAKTGKALVADASSQETEEPKTEDIMADDSQLEDVLEEGALEAEKEKQAAAEEDAKAKAAAAAAKAEAQAAKEAEKAAKDEAEATEEAETETENKSGEEAKDE